MSALTPVPPPPPPPPAAAIAVVALAELLIRLESDTALPRPSNDATLALFVTDPDVIELGSRTETLIVAELPAAIAPRLQLNAVTPTAPEQAPWVVEKEESEAGRVSLSVT